MGWHMSRLKAVHSLLALYCFSMALACSGCGPSLGNISGKITLPDGEPLPYAKIRIVCDGGNKPVLPGEVRDGSYSFKNVPYGNIAIELETIPPPEKTDRDVPEVPEIKGPAGSTSNAGPYVPIKKKYKSVTTSGLKFEVKSNSETFNFKLDRSME